MACPGYKYVPNCTAGVQKSQAKVRPNVDGRSSVQNPLHVTLLAPRILRWLTELWNTSAPMLHINLYAQKSASVLLHVYGYKMRAK